MSEAVSSQIDIAAEPEAILEVLTNFESYPDWAKAVKSVRVVDTDKKGRASQVEFEVTPGPLPKVRYILKYRYEPNRLSWDYVEGDLKDMSGSYTLESDGGQTKVTFDLTADIAGFPIPGFLKSRAAREIARVALQELKKRVETG